MLERRSASLFGREKAKAVPWADFGFAPMSVMRFVVVNLNSKAEWIVLANTHFW